MARFEVPEGWVMQAYRFALHPSPSLERSLWSHAGAARFARNHMVGLVKAVLDQRAAERTYGIAEDGLTPVPGVVAPGSPARLERTQGHLRAVVGRELQGGIQHRPGLPRPLTGRMVEVPQGPARRIRYRIPPVPLSP
jgi:hypothetical protein